jgi:ATP-dependent Zn protease
MKNNGKVLLGYIVFIFVLILIGSSVLSQTNQEEIKYSDIVQWFKNDEVKSFTVDQNNQLEIVKKIIKVTYRSQVHFSMKI